MSLILMALLGLLAFANAQSACSNGEQIFASDLNYPINNPADLVAVTNATWFAESFRTGAGDARTVSSVTIRLGTASGNGTVEIWNDNGRANNNPLTLLATVGPISNPTSVAEVQVFSSGLDISLNGNTTYWVVMRAFTGTLEWVVSSGIGDGEGDGSVLGKYSVSSNQGTTWAGSPDNPSFFAVSVCNLDGVATPTPNPNSPLPSGVPTPSRSPSPGPIGGDGDDSSSAARASSFLSLIF